MKVFRAMVLLQCALCMSGVWSSAQDQETVQQQVADHLKKAQAYLSEKDATHAIPELQAVVKLDPGNVEAQGNLGVLLFFRGDYADAAPALRTAFAKDPGLAKVQMLLGLSEKRLGQPDRALDDLDRAFPKLTDPKMRIEAGLELIDLDTAAGRMDKAATIVAELQQIEPANARLLYIAYRLHSDLANESMLSLSMVAPDSAEMHAVMGYEQSRQGNDAAAIAQLRKALAIDPKLSGAQFELADLLSRSTEASQRSAAVRAFQAALKINPYDDRAACELGDIEFEKGDLKDAQADYARALKIQPMSPYATLGMAKTLLEMNRLNEGTAMLEKAVQLDPSNASAHYRLATRYRQEGNTGAAREQMEDFQKLRELKEKLQALYAEMRLQPPTQNEERDSR